MRIQFKEKYYEIELDNVSHDHDYWCDAYISKGFSIDENYRELNENELDEMTNSIYMDRWIQNWLY